MPAERLQKLLAAAGYGSRRGCEELIAAGRVRVNGQVASLGDKADPARDQVTLDGEPIAAERRVYVLLHKPRGVISSLKPQGQRRTVRDYVPLPERVYPVGRLDAESEGLILLTNDGDLANRVTHPRYGYDKEYDVLVAEYPPEEVLAVWRRGVVLENGERTAPAAVTRMKQGASGTWLKVVLREGRKRQVRRVAQTLGLRVKQLRRVRLGTLRLGKLRPGEWRELTPAEVRALRSYSARKGVRSHRRR